MARLLHVDEVDHDQAGHVAEPQLACDLGGRLDIGVVGGLLDIVLARRPARVDVDRHQGFGRIDHQIAARFQLDGGLVHCVELVLDAVALKQGRRLGVLIHPFDVARHQQLHEAARGLITLLALDDHLVDVAVIKVADRALDEVAVAVNESRRGTLQRPFADLVPQPREIVEVALDLDLGARQAGGTDDQPHGRGQLQVRHDRLQPLAVGAVRDLARDAAAVRGVGHQHAIASGEAQIGGQSRAFVAALFLDDLDQQHLAALDDVLDLVAAAQILAALPQLVGGGFVDRRTVGSRPPPRRSRRRSFIAIVFGRASSSSAAASESASSRFGRAKPLFLRGVFGFLAQQRVAIGLGDLVVIRMDFREGQEAVAVAAIVDERRLERGLHAGDLG